MKITDLQALTIQMNGWRYPIVKLDTDEGIYGLGEGRDGSDQRLLVELKPYLLGEDPTNVERIFQKIRVRGGRGATGRHGGGVSGVEMALWDIAGKAAGVPVYKLIGGQRRKKIRVYVDGGSGKLADGTRPPRFPEIGWEEAYTPTAYAESAKFCKELGYSIIKFDLGYHNHFLNVPGYAIGQQTSERGLQAELACVHAIKEVLGDEIGLCLDLDSEDYLASARHLALSSALQLCKSLESYNILWFEDALSNAHLDAWIQLTRATTVPTLTGEDLYLRYDFLPFFRQHAIDIAHPDIATAGGILEGKKIGDLAELFGISIAQHCAGSPISFIANVHCAATQPDNFLALEFHAADMPNWNRLVKGLATPLVDKGFVDVPDKPGLGVDLEEKTVRRYLHDKGSYFR